MNSQSPTFEGIVIDRLARIDERMVTKNQVAAALFALLLVAIPGGISIWGTVRATAQNTASLQQSVATSAANQRNLDQGQVDSLKQSITNLDAKIEAGKLEREKLRGDIAQNYSRLGGVRSTVDEIADSVNNPPKKARWFQR
jgi:hypothetical protein